MSTLRVNTIQSTTPNTAISIDSAGNCNFSGTISQGGSKIIQWVEVTPAVTEWSFTGSRTSDAYNLNPAAIPAAARYVLADVFATASFSDHQNFVISRDPLSNQKNWVDSRGQQPSGQFGALARQAIILNYTGESDGYTPNYGTWYSSQHIPTNGRTIYFGNYGNSNSNGWLYIVTKAYSL